MLRITTCSGSGVTRFIVEGKLTASCASELEKCWESALSVDSQQTLLVDLSGVNFVDARGRQLLSRMHARGTKFVAAGILPKCLVEEIEGSECNGE